MAQKTVNTESENPWADQWKWIKRQEEEAAQRQASEQQDDVERIQLRNRAIYAEFEKKEAEKKARKEKRARAARQLGNSSLGGNRISGYLPKIYPVQIKQEPYVAFGAEAAQNPTQLSGVAMAKVPRRLGI